MAEMGVSSVLLVEDDDALRSLLAEELEGEGLDVHTADSAEKALEILEDTRIGLVVSDLRLPGADGMTLLREVRELSDPPSFIVITAFGTIDQAVQCLKEGADDFLTKPLDLDHLSLRVARVLENRSLRSEVHRYREMLEGDEFHGMVGRSPPMRKMFAELKRVAKGRGPVLILGESGVGKELAARAVHAEGPRAKGPFLAVNCAGVPESLLESEFFGHVKGAFSGAARTRGGLFQEARGGTLLLDEIGEMPTALQAKLLRVLQEGAVRPVGSDRTVPVDVRVLASTNQDLKAAMEEGRFRRDLFYRLETFHLVVPPLRERGDDVELLTVRLIHRYSMRLGISPPPPSRAFLESLREYTFPGNVRELENMVERAVTFSEGKELDPGHLPERAGATADLPEPPGETALPLALLKGDGLPTLKEVEERYLKHVLETAGGNKRRAAALLGISRGTLYRRLEDLEEDTQEQEG